jgi:predicted alpha/beta-fold hydrolase
MDLNWVVGQLIDRFPNSPLFLIGFSLGGNVLLKWLGEEGKNLPAQVQAACAISVPFDLAVSARRIDQGFNRIYASVFLKTLKEKALAKEKQYPGLVDPKRVSKIVSFAQFDNEVTAPVHGFKNGEDYWVSSSSIRFLTKVQIPTLLISAQDDPFLPIPYLPRKAIEQSKWLTGCFPSRGGHVGFVEGKSPWGVSYWSESKTFAFFSDFV